MKIELKTPKYKTADLRKSNIYMRQNKSTGKLFAIQREENYQQTRTEKQAASRRGFGEKSHAVSEWLKVSENLNSKTYAEAERAFKRQDRYSTMRGFLIANAERYGIM